MTSPLPGDEPRGLYSGRPRQEAGPGALGKGTLAANQEVLEKNVRRAMEI